MMRFIAIMSAESIQMFRPFGIFIRCRVNEHLYQRMSVSKPPSIIFPAPPTTYLGTNYLLPLVRIMYIPSSYFLTDSALFFLFGYCCVY